MTDAAARASGSSLPSGLAPGQADHIEPRHLFAFIAMVFGMFMAILDIQIVSASLTEIQAGLSASADEIPWVQTAYLIAEVVMIPLSGLLSRAMGTRILFSLSAGGFTLASLACGLSTSMQEMIFWRAVQGFIGGGMIPTVFATAYIVFPRSKFALVTPIIGLVATLAPTIGPTVGGWLTDQLSWRWLFFINIVPGICVTAAALTLIDFDKPHWALFDKFDWLGLLAMAGFLGALEFVLEDGPRYDWFQDDTIRLFGWVSVLSAVVFFVRAFTAEQPIVDLRTFGDRNFAIGSLLAAMVGVGLYGLTLVYPLYLGRIRGYNALMIGETMFVSGAAMMMVAPLIGRLLNKVDPRLMMVTGSLIFALGTWRMTFMTADWDFWELFWPQVCRGVGMMATMIPVQNVALGTLPLDRVKNASGLFNLMRNLGGAIGLAGINTILNDRTDLHLARLHERLTWAHQPALERLDQMIQRLQDRSDAADMALKQLMQLAHQQAVVMAFADVLLLLTAIFVALAALALLLRKPDAASSAADAGH